MITKKGSLSKYIQIADTLRGKISSGEFEENDKLPNEDELSIQFKASRGTVREAIRLLVDEGLLRREQGRGTFVNSLQRSGMFTLTSFDEDMLRQNRMPSTQLLAAELIPAGDELAGRLEISLGEPVIHVVQLKLADGKPVARETRYLAHKLCPGLLGENLTDDSIHYMLVYKFNIPLVKIQHVVEIHNLSPDDAQILQADPEALAFSVDRLSFTNLNGRVSPAVWFQALYRQEMYQFRAKPQNSL
jgi:DNA-binding GntR family transcriptional regulator